jgi:hypothetical protein
MQRVLAEAQSLIIEMRWSLIATVPAEDAILFRNAHKASRNLR